LPLSWDHREQKGDVTLQGHRWSLTRKLKMQLIRKYKTSASVAWPTLMLAQSEARDVGIIKLEIDMAYVFWDSYACPSVAMNLTTIPDDEVEVHDVVVECEVEE
jgi:hypothetical protein